jgi:hypothetical protein
MRNAMMAIPIGGIPHQGKTETSRLSFWDKASRKCLLATVDLDPGAKNIFLRAIELEKFLLTAQFIFSIFNLETTS